MIMIKNVYFCVTKMKVDNPTDNFYLILLGTDRLETFFGLVRMAVGTDVNVDTLQLGSRVSGLIEVAAILAEHPEWDHGTHRLTLPVISQHDGEILSKLLGRSKAVELIPELGPALMDLTASDSKSFYDILAPLEQPLVNQYDDNDEYDTTVLSGSSQSVNLKDDLVVSPGHPYTHNGDIEDAIANELPRNQVTSDITIQGAPSLRIGNPIAVLVQSGELIVLAVAQINRIRFAGRDNLEELPLHLLGNPSAAVDFQVLCLHPATVEDDPTQVHDWCWS
ncbi:hypothetical protein BGW80DRAFT_1457549 [Lactifluus volemus]|nr:hypothetical protein BGW80DRAFT_1457549 [Lactifluus volemus]